MNPTNPTLAVDTTRQLTVTGLYGDGGTADLNSLARWTAANQAVATVSNAKATKGFVRAVGHGSTAVNAAYGGQSAGTTVTVSPATLVALEVSPVDPLVVLGNTRQMLATGHYSDGSTQDLTGSAKWTAAHHKVATVAQTGLVRAVGVGSTAVDATVGALRATTTITVVRQSTLESIEVSPSNASVVAGQTLQFTATGTYSDGSTQDLTQLATWASSDRSVATVSNAAGSPGLATGVGAGSVQLSAQWQGVVGSTELTVT